MSRSDTSTPLLFEFGVEAILRLHYFSKLELKRYFDSTTFQIYGRDRYFDSTTFQIWSQTDTSTSLLFKYGVEPILRLHYFSNLESNRYLSEYRFDCPPMHIKYFLRCIFTPQIQAVGASMGIDNNLKNNELKRLSHASSIVEGGGRGGGGRGKGGCPNIGRVPG